MWYISGSSEVADFPDTASFFVHERDPKDNLLLYAPKQTKNARGKREKRK